MRRADDTSIACVHASTVVNFRRNAKGGEPIEPEELGEWGVPRSGMIGRNRERDGGRQGAAMIAASPRRPVGAAASSAFADLRDFLIGDLAFSAFARRA